jgi:hypothetical protein
MIPITPPRRKRRLTTSLNQFGSLPIRKMKHQDSSIQPMTTDVTIQPRSMGDLPDPTEHTPPTSQTQRASESTDEQATTFSSAATIDSGDQSTPSLITLSPKLTLAEGCYLLIGVTGAGKTAAVTALVDMINEGGVAATYLSTFESRSPKYTNNRFSNASNYFTDVKRSLQPSKVSKVLVLDSITLPLAASGSASTWLRQPTFAGGSQPSQFELVEKLGQLGRATAACIIAIINTDLIAYAADLQAISEGFITVIDVANITVRDRTANSRRKSVPFTIPIQNVQRALNKLGLGVFQPSNGSTTAYPQAGLYSRR